MEHTTLLSPPSSLTRRLTAGVEPPAVSAWALAFALVTYLALRNGGYDTIVRSEVGVAVWWTVLLGALAGLLPGQIGRAGWVAIGLLGAFVVWTGVAALWSVSPGDTIDELGREATYAGFLVLAVAVQGRTAARHTLGGLATACGLVTALAVVSRLHPGWFPAGTQLRLLGPQAVRRLSYPLNYWNALAAFAAIGIPLLVAVAVDARHLATRAVAAAALPVTALCMYLTVSRGGVLELGVGVAVLLVLVPRRIEASATLLLGGAGGAVLIWGASNRAALRTGLRTPAALHQGSELLVLTIVVCAGVALLQAAIGLAATQFPLPPWVRPSRRRTARRALALAAVVAAAALAAGVPGKLSTAWHDFKAPNGVVVPTSDATVFSRLSAVNGNGRYQFWVAAENANETRPLTGIGPGTFQYWWHAHATTDGSVVNAHSLYFETLAETGIIGLVLVGALFMWFLGVALRHSLAFRASTSMRITTGAAAAGVATFMTAAALEWVWQMAAIAAMVLLLGAVIVAGRDDVPPVALTSIRRRAAHLPLPVLAVAALVAVSIPFAATIAIQASQNAAEAGNLSAAYRDSLTAERIEPYAVAPRLQEALVLEAAGQLGPAATAARIATRKAPTDWEAWVTLARIDARRGVLKEALAAFTRARALDPRNSMWTGPA